MKIPRLRRDPGSLNIALPEHNFPGVKAGQLTSKDDPKTRKPAVKMYGTAEDMEYVTGILRGIYRLQVCTN